MKRFLLALVLLMLLPLGAQAVMTVPANITEIQDEAFAGTNIDALIIPETVQTVGNGILKGSNAAYILAESADTSFAADTASGARFVFAPAGSDALYLPGYRTSDNLQQKDGLYYFVLVSAEALCAVEPSALSGSITIPKLLDGAPVSSVNNLYLANTGVTELYVPQYLHIPEGLNAIPYYTMTAAEPETSVSQSPAGHSLTWITASSDGFGEVTYEWTFTCGDETITRLTSEPTVTYAPMTAGEWTVSVVARDAIGDFSAMESSTVTITAPQARYRALLIGNTYPGTSSSLPGPDNDLFSMLTVLNSMDGTPYEIRSGQNLTAGGIQAAIATTFAGAQPSDVSLFYYSGHGSSDGALVGTNETFLSVYGLRTALQNIPGTKIVILDCCHAGHVIGRSTESQNEAAAFNRAVIQAFSAQNRSSENLADQGFVVLTACRKDQVSSSVSTGRTYFGAFTYGLCYGSGYDEWHRQMLANMPADADNNGVITLGEAISGVRERIDYIREYLPSVEQEVQYYGDESFILWMK